jgi:signal peptidase I
MDGFSPRRRRYALRRFLAAIVLTISFLLILHTFFLEPYQVPTGSMAPALLGHHRSGVCPRCGIVVNVGRTHADGDGAGGEGCYARAFCPNCGCQALCLGQAPESQGDHVLVNKSVYSLRSPRRWEVIVFRLFGKTFIKRLIGLGGEEIEIIDGDIYIDGELTRKSFDEFLAMRVPVFDSRFAPEPNGWQDRWEFQPVPSPSTSARERLLLDGRNFVQQLTYRHFSLDESKCEPITDEYAYNGGSPAPVEAVHDFMVDAEVEIMAGQGTLAFSLNDGGVQVEVELGVGATRDVLINLIDPEESAGLGRVARLSSDFVRLPGKVQLLQGKSYHVEMALVDRRLSMRVDGVNVFAPLDLPSPRNRAAVTRPLSFTADGVLACLRRVQLYRDVQYSQVGNNAVRGQAVHLAINQSFVLGDNSANSEDSRFWPKQGVVPAENIVGRAFLVHLPSRAVSFGALGRHWLYQLPDWDQIRWLK